MTLLRQRAEGEPLLAAGTVLRLPSAVLFATGVRHWRRNLLASCHLQKLLLGYTPSVFFFFCFSVREEIFPPLYGWHIEAASFLSITNNTTNGRFISLDG